MANADFNDEAKARFRAMLNKFHGTNGFVKNKTKKTKKMGVTSGKTRKGNPYIFQSTGKKGKGYTTKKTVKKSNGKFMNIVTKVTVSKSPMLSKTKLGKKKTVKRKSKTKIGGMITKGRNKGKYGAGMTRANGFNWFNGEVF